LPWATARRMSDRVEWASKLCRRSKGP